MLSVITVVYNDLKALTDTVNSLRNTNLDLPWEHIIIDGASTDGTKKYLQTLHEKNVVVKSEPDFGIYDAMNKGIKLASGDFLLFLNAGDTIHGHLKREDVRDWSVINVLVGYKNKSYPEFSLLAPFAMPYCHQGLIFPNNNLIYDVKYKISSDLDFVYRHGIDKFNLRNRVKTCYIKFDDGGISNRRFVLRDAETAIIIFKYNPLKGIIFMAVRLFALPLKLLFWK